MKKDFSLESDIVATELPAAEFGNFKDALGLKVFEYENSGKRVFLRCRPQTVEQWNEAVKFGFGYVFPLQDLAKEVTGFLNSGAKCIQAGRMFTVAFNPGITLGGEKVEKLVLAATDDFSSKRFSAANDSHNGNRAAELITHGVEVVALGLPMIIRDGSGIYCLISQLEEDEGLRTTARKIFI